MLDEGRRRAARGTDVVVGYVECHGRPHTEAMLDGLEVLDRARREYRGRTYPEIDLDAVLRRRPDVVLVDELAHSNVPGCRNAKRWQDVQELLAAGIDVVATVNIQHLESLNDVVVKITRVPQLETVPDDVVRRADQIELVDIPPEALRRRMAHGNIYPPEKIDAALANYFLPGNLTALRELALFWTADRVDEALRKYRSEHGIGRVWETRERVVVALTGGPEGETLIRRAARIADRTAQGGALLAVHVVRSDGLAAGASHSALARQRRLVESVGGSYHTVVGDDVATALVEFARAENATQLVLGTSRRGRLERFLTGRGIGETTVALSSDIDVHMVTHERAGRGRLLPSRRRTLPTSRLVAGPVAGLVLPVLLTLFLDRTRGTFNLTSEALLFLVTVVGVASIGGVVSALVAAVAASLLLNYWFIAPIGEFSFRDPDNLLALVVFALVAGTVAAIVDRSLRMSRRAAAATADAETLSSSPATSCGATRRFRRSWPVRGRPSRWTQPNSSSSRWTTPPRPKYPWDLISTSSCAAAPCRPPNAGSSPRSRPMSPRPSSGPGSPRPPPRSNRSRPPTGCAPLCSRPSATTCAPPRRGLGGGRLPTQPGRAVHGRGTGRTARHRGRVHGAPQPAHRQSAGHEQAPGRSAHVESSRHESGGGPALRPGLAAPGRGTARAPRRGGDPAGPRRPATPRTRHRQPHRQRRALRPPGTPVLITASALADRVEVRVVDRGPGLPPTDRERVFEPFQRLGDTDNTTGVGLGLALSRGLTEAMAGTLTPEDTPGGGLTMVVSLPVAEPAGTAAARTPYGVGTQGAAGM